MGHLPSLLEARQHQDWEKAGYSKAYAPTKAPASQAEGPAQLRCPAMSSPAALAPFRTRSFRFQWPADLCTAWALEMETLILGWYVLVESGSVWLLTAFGALMFVGTLLAPMLGMLGDRLGLRRLLAAMRLSYALTACVILFLALTGRLDPSWVLGVAFLVGLIKPSDIGMRTALVSASVPAAHLAAAMGISRTTQDSARIGGALAGTGFMAAFGMAPAYGAIVAIYLLAVFLTLRSASPAQAASTERASAPATTATPQQPSPWRDLKEGLLYVWHTPRLRAAMSLAALANLTVFPLTGGLMPYIARDVFQVGQQGLGWLVASFASGALIGSLTITALGSRVLPARTMLAGCVVWHLCLASYALPITMPAAMVLLMGAGIAQSLSMVSLAILLLRSADERFRGRVMGVRMLAIYTLPLGLLAAGTLIPAIGFRAMAGLYVGLGLLLTAAIAFIWRQDLLPREAPANAR